LVDSVLVCLYAVTKVLRQIWGLFFYLWATGLSRAAFPPALAAYFVKTSIFIAVNASVADQGHIQGVIWAIAPPETYESNFIPNVFLQFRKKHSRNKAILLSIVLSQQCCESVHLTLQ